MKHLPALLLVVLGTLATLPARAEPRDLKALYETVKADLKAGRTAEALATCERALAEQPADAELRWGFQIGAGLAADKLGRPAEALGHLERFLVDHEARRRDPSAALGAGRGADWEQRRKGVQAQADRLEQALLTENARVSFESSPPGATVTLDGQPPRGADNATTPLRVFLAPGPHKLRLEREGFVSAELDVTVKVGRRDTVHVPLVALQKAAPAPIVTPLQAAAPVAASPVKAPAKAVTPAASPVASAAVPMTVQTKAPALRPVWGWLAVGVGGAVLLGGIPFTVLAATDADKLGSIDPHLGAEAGAKRYHELENSMNTNQTVAWVLYGLGAAIAAGGATYLVFFADHAADDGPGTTTLQPGLVPLEGGAALTLRGGW